jgi:hypothetical protein
MTWMKYKRLKSDSMKWMDIKELEKDYELFVSDEYAH